MATKNNPGTYDCYAKAHPDEPMFVLLARDPIAPKLVEEWANRMEAWEGYSRTGDPSAKVLEARACAVAMRDWNAANVKPDVAPVVHTVGGIDCVTIPAEEYERLRGLEK